MISIDIAKAVAQARPVAIPIFSTTPTAAKERKEMKPRIVKRNSQFQSSLATACCALLVLCAGQPVFAQQGAQVPPATAVQVAAATTTPNAKPLATLAESEEKEDAAPAKLGHEAIKVHGHWVLQVKNADGTLGERREFENSLADGGRFLVTVLAGSFVPGDYAVDLSGTACSGCYIINSTWPANNGFTQGAPTSATLLTTYNSTIIGGSVNSIVLAGFIPPPNSGMLSQVAVIYSACISNVNNVTPSTITPAACATGPAQQIASGYFTSTTLASPLPVSAGQIVMVTVTISFS